MNGEYEMKREKVLCCNCCGKEFIMEDGIMQEECIALNHSFGYFSKERDGKKQSFTLCEDCYDSIIKTFRIKPQTDDETELI